MFFVHNYLLVVWWAAYLLVRRKKNLMVDGINAIFSFHYVAIDTIFFSIFVFFSLILSTFDRTVMWTFLVKRSFLLWTIFEQWIVVWTVLVKRSFLVLWTIFEQWKADKLQRHQLTVDLTKKKKTLWWYAMICGRYVVNQGRPWVNVEERAEEESQFLTILVWADVSWPKLKFQSPILLLSPGKTTLKGVL